MKTRKIDFSKYSNIRIGGEFEVEILDEIKSINGVIIGGCNNTLICAMCLFEIKKV